MAVSLATAAMVRWVEAVLAENAAYTVLAWRQDDSLFGRRGDLSSTPPPVRSARFLPCHGSGEGMEKRRKAET